MRKSLMGFLLSVILVVMIVVLLFPLYWMLLTAIRPQGEVLASKAVLVDFRRANFGIFREIFQRPAKPLSRWIVNSLIVTFGTMILALPISVLGGYSLSRFQRYRENYVLGYFLLVVRMLPPSLLIIPMYVIFLRLGLLDNFASLILTGTVYVLPFGVWLMKSFYDSIPRDLEEAAMVDGATILGAVRRIILPLAVPGVGATAVYIAIQSWAEYLFAATFMSNRNFTVTVGATTYIGEYGIVWNGLMAASLVGMLPLIVAFVLFEKSLVRGLVGGAVK